MIPKISKPENGMILFDSTQNCFRVYANDAWSGCLPTGDTSKQTGEIANPPVNLDSRGSVGIGTDNPAPRAILELKSDNKALKLPRVDNAYHIVNPTTGMLVYDESLKCVRGYIKSNNEYKWTYCNGLITN
ncbi:hypothetical protein [Ornithobacterium rhinotracheale]